ncbi:sugar ABC transporter substrate-binding protein [Halanaerobium hydrogeniformans]|uniref:Periplasmic binding protein/LacI transcriptional regulator n=1 Tax=Halanaerobium hydrogeniformans TaxID=656519 RepID=E4RNW2_HALHG|nr:sugar ABC transporter substrate-binding protein [Halanaerobium hydrogeniformans]ADQ13652.1 periplasmic binding protein/LacI transcriptional regulator [Halanaerobium hydrogeniformans]
MKKTNTLIIFLGLMLIITGFLNITVQAQDDVIGVAEEDAEYNIGFIVKTMANPYFARMKDGAEEAALDFNINLTWVSAQEHTDAEGQLNLVEDMIQREMDAIVINPVGPEAIVPAIKQANERGIPVVIVDTTAAGGDIVTFVGMDNVDAASDIAEYVAQEMNGKGNIAILEGVRGHSTAEERLVGYNNVIDQYPELNVVASQAANYDRSEGMRVTENFLVSNPDLDLIISSNDEMGLGAIRAIMAAGRQNQVKVVGFDAIDDALVSVKNGEMLATVESVPDMQAYESVKAAVDYLNGKEVPSEIIVPCVVVDQSNVDEFLD